jgi:hypothetical protein
VGRACCFQLKVFSYFSWTYNMYDAKKLGIFFIFDTCCLWVWLRNEKQSFFTKHIYLVYSVYNLAKLIRARSTCSYRWEVVGINLDWLMCTMPKSFEDFNETYNFSWLMNNKVLLLNSFSFSNEYLMDRTLN